MRGWSNACRVEERGSAWAATVSGGDGKFRLRMSFAVIVHPLSFAGVDLHHDSAQRKSVPEMLGEFLREASVLLLVFGGALESHTFGLRLVVIVLLGLALLVVGVALERRRD